MRTRLIVIISIVLSGFSLGTSSAGASVPAKTSTKSISVKLLEFKMNPSLDHVASGRVKFTVKNVGSEKHEMVVVRTDGAKLPTKADGSIDEDAIAKANKFGEVGELKTKKSGTLLVKALPAGRYVLFCNIVDKESDGSTLSHYKQGMWTELTVA